MIFEPLHKALQKTLPIGILMSLLACTDYIEAPDIISVETNIINIGGVIEQDYQSRADDDGFTKGDRMGVYIVDYVGHTPGILTADRNRANNAAFEFDGTRWSCTSPFYWKDKETQIDVYGYYPYSNSVTDVDNHTFEVEIDQNSHEDGAMGGYEKSDLLWAANRGVSPTTDVIRLQYTHRMAGILVTLTKGNGISDTEWSKVEKRVTVDNTVRTAYVDLSKGTVTAYGSADKGIRMADQGDCTYRAVTVPQNIETGTRLLGITIDGTSYAYTRTEPLTLTSGKLHRFTLKIDKKDGGDYTVALVNEEITPWENDKLTHNFFESEYLVVNVKETGTLKSTIEAMGKDFTKIKNLKVSGPLTNCDFDFMREEMSELAMLNLKEVTCKDIIYQYGWEEYEREILQDAIPPSAFRDKQTLRRIVLPDNITRICDNAFLRIGLDVNSSVILPKHLKRVDGGAFYCIEEAGELVLNDELEYIGNSAFARTAFRCEFKLPQTLKYIGENAFGEEGNNAYFMHFTGHFMLPENLEHYGKNEYDYWDRGPFVGVTMDEVGEIIVPEVVTSLNAGMFPYFTKGCYVKMHNGIKSINSLPGRFINHIDIPEGVTKIGHGAFGGSEFTSGVTLPSTLKSFDSSAFCGARISGDLTVPEGVSIIPNEFIASGQVERVTLPSTIMSIEEDAFRGCGVREVNIGKYCDVIGRRAFAGCGAMTRMVCLSPQPPTLVDANDDYYYAFSEVDFDHFILEVPESSIDLYRNAPGWSKIKFITPHHELAVNLSQLNCLDAGITYESLVRAESEWVVSECPSWCHVTPASSKDRMTEVKITVDKTSSGNDREGRIVFKLRDNDYTTYTDVHQYGYEYAQDNEIVLQRASAGAKAIPVFIVGEGYDATSICDGRYMQAVNDVYESLFAIEPFKTYRDYFTVTTAVACSADDGIQLSYSKSTCFDAFMDGFGFHINFDKIKDYAIRNSALIDHSNVGNALIITFTNFNAFIGVTRIDDDGTSMATVCRVEDTYPYDFRGLVQHYGGGVAFGKLAPEYVTHYEFLKGCCCEQCKALNEYNRGVAKGWYGNVALTGSMNSVPWAHLIFDPRYSDIVDVYEGAYRHQRGAYRSESQSCMSTYINYFNTISREIIVKRIKQLAGEKYSFDDFVSLDKRD